MKSAALLATAAATAVTLLAGVESCLAQDASTPPPPPPPAANGPERPDKLPREGGDKDRDKDKGWHRSDNRGPGGPGGSGYGGGYSRGDRERGDMFKGLPEEERQRVREAFEKAWQDPEVIAARDRMSKANEEMRSALHEALKKADPEVVKILEKVRPPGGFPGMARMPDPADPEFVPQVTQRLGGELQAWARFDRREVDTKPMHERIIQVPAVKEAILRAKEATVEQRPEAWRRLREAYFGAAKAEFMQAWGKSPWDRDRERGPGGFGPGPAFGGDNRDRDRGERPPPPLRPEGESTSPKAPEPKSPQ